MYKKLLNNVIATLEVPAEAKRSNGTERKCRCEYARVLQLTNQGIKETTAFSMYDTAFIYRIGEIVRADYFDEDRWSTCSHGIHFFLTREEAEAYDG